MRPLRSLVAAVEGRRIYEAKALGPFRRTPLILVVPDVLYVEIMYVARDVASDSQ